MQDDNIRRVTIRPVDAVAALEPIRLTVQIIDSVSGFVGVFSVPAEMEQFQRRMEEHCNANNILLVDDEITGERMLRADVDSPWIKIASRAAHAAGVIDGEGYDPRFENNPIFLGLPEHVDLVIAHFEHQGRTFFRLTEGVGNTDNLSVAQREAIITLDELRQAVAMARQNSEFTAIMVAENGTLGFTRAVDLPATWIDQMDKALGIIRD